MKYVLIQTDLFFTDIPDDQLDQWFLGADCAGWFYTRLLPVEEIKQGINPTMEDWGWIMSIYVNDIEVQIYIWEYIDNKTNDDSWVLGIASKKRLMKKHSPEQLAEAEGIVTNSLNTILSNDSRFERFKWFENNPMEIAHVENVWEIY